MIIVINKIKNYQSNTIHRNFNYLNLRFYGFYNNNNNNNNKNIERKNEKIFIYFTFIITNNC